MNGKILRLFHLTSGVRQHARDSAELCSGRPLRREEVHKEYSRDDFYTRLSKHDWEVDVANARPDCVPVHRRVTRVY